MPALQKLLSSVVTILFPQRATERLLGDTSLSEYESLMNPRTLSSCEALLPYRDRRVAALIWELKYKDSTRAADIAGEILSNHVVALLAEEMVVNAILVPVPLHPERERVRGYNQCERIAQHALTHAHEHITLLPQALTRIKNTQSQTRLSAKARKENMRGAFSADPSLVRGKTIVLIDDVVTTGATLEEAAKELRAAGAARSIVIALTYA